MYMYKMYETAGHSTVREMPPVVNVNVINLPAISAQDSDNSGDTGRLNAKGVNHLHGRFPSHPAPPPLSPWLHVPLSCSSLRPAVFSRPWHSLPLLRPAVRPELTPTRFPCLRAFPQCPLHLRQYDVSPVRTPRGSHALEGVLCVFSVSGVYGPGRFCGRCRTARRHRRPWS